MIGDKEMDIFDSTDMHGQSRILPTIKALFSGCTLQIEQHYEDKGGVDIYITATTKSGKEVLYAIECKDRKMSHTKYQDSGYIIEDHKMKELMKAANKGYRPLYLNSFNDDYVIIWNLNNIDLNECGETGEKQFHRTTVKKSNNDIYTKNKITLKNKQAEWIGRII